MRQPSLHSRGRPPRLLPERWGWRPRGPRVTQLLSLLTGEKEKFTTCFTAVVWNETCSISEVCLLTGTNSLSVLAKCAASPETSSAPLAGNHAPVSSARVTSLRSCSSSQDRLSEGLPFSEERKAESRPSDVPVFTKPWLCFPSTSSFPVCLTGPATELCPSAWLLPEHSARRTRLHHVPVSCNSWTVLKLSGSPFSVECPASPLLTPPQGLQEPKRGQREQQGVRNGQLHAC
ncbi:uncharacterized protein [Odocoileus virginianus]|uniref:Uncharacterized protein n=1 Tax=Odocoileus virginianus TaxID=9874 RepID=A0ABM4H7U0_ODOVR